MKIKNNIKLAVSSMILASVFSGCALENLNISTPSNQMVSSGHFIDVTKEDYDNKSIQNGIYSLSGLLSIPKLGFTYFHTENRKPLYMVGYSKDKSFYITQTIETSKNKNIEETLENLRDKMLSLRVEALKIIENKIKHYSIDATSMKLILKEDNNNNSLKNKFDKSYQELAKDIKQSGIFVLSWDGNSANKNKSNSNFTSTFSSSDKKDDKFKESGFMILNGLKISTLYAGKDMIDYWTDINTNIVKKTNTYPRVVTSTIQAKDIYYYSQINYKQEIQKMIDIHFSDIIKLITAFL